MIPERTLVRFPVSRGVDIDLDWDEEGKMFSLSTCKEGWNEPSIESVTLTEEQAVLVAVAILRTVGFPVKGEGQ